MDATLKLYWQDVLASSFETCGAALGTLNKKPSIVLPQTIFYPEGGGQLGDIGTLTVGPHLVRIADTQIEEGAIHHVVDGDLSADLVEDLRSARAIDMVVRGSVDEP